MLEKLLLAAAITFSLNLFVGVSVPAGTHRDSELNRQPGAPQIAMELASPQTVERSQPVKGSQL
ncbi:hypothetical protein [Kamptonema formosum]|uniref:hypothetical protein n=1 Tax=Kamptonema formosum TaxID=331992 RepID=UPI0003494608|nr:hypothetical protein [Oscillatoria sp. PCC 10802]